MDDDVFNMGLRQFLKQVGVTSQRALEEAVRQAEDDGKLAGQTKIRARMVLTVDGVGLNHVVEDDIKLG
ncbi:MAG: DUF6494 family protein [Dongiaceae bacterium]